MAFTTQSHAGISFAERWAAFRSDMAEAHVRRKTYRITRNELSNLSDRELNDLGISRAMIKRIAMEAAGYV
ncbi:protein of unknown function [Cognatiyoonia koreensis]|uniref:YjiS-like domain-containing protein n=1 Tax=Cognatiyoonia koreensis TaxID=364200 RepID=A0A1I0Q3B6_9RHOB|nr:DUF1127 domain-containing protein [Cognatiyoonia koreensis]SEW21461.1 protein of unknown function [Cognatiyoonia koreensis]